MKRHLGMLQYCTGEHPPTVVSMAVGPTANDSIVMQNFETDVYFRKFKKII
jgi:hypothetical protein